MSVLGIRDAADVIGVSHSTVSRYLKRYPDLNRGTAGRPLVDVDEYRLHRGENIHVPASGDAPTPAVPAVPADPASASAADADADVPSYNKEKARREKANATTAELNLAERLGKVVPRDEVEATIFEAGQALRDAMERRSHELSERLAVMNDPAAIAALLEQEDRKLLKEFLENLQAAVADESDDAAAA